MTESMKVKLISTKYCLKDLGKSYIQKPTLKIVMKVIGKKEKCMEKESYNGKIDQNMKDNIPKA